MSSVRLMVLGMLDSGDALHGYRIYRSIHEWRAETWTNIKPASIYHALAYLEKNDYIDNAGVKPDSGGPSATSYRINAKGREELYRLIKVALVAYDQEKFTAGLAWMHLLTRQEVLLLAKERLEQYQQTAQYMRTLPRETHPTHPDKHPEIIDSWTVIFDATAAWMQDFIRHIKDGQYNFRGEK